MNVLYIRGRWVRLWHNGQVIWLGSPLRGESMADMIGRGSDYCFAWTGERPEIRFEETKWEEDQLRSLVAGKA